MAMWCPGCHKSWDRTGNRMDFVRAHAAHSPTWAAKWERRSTHGRAGAQATVSVRDVAAAAAKAGQAAAEPVAVREPKFGADVAVYVPAAEPAIVYYPRRIGDGKTDVDILERAWQERRHFLITGKPGTGKSTAPWVVAQKLRLPIVRISMDVAKDPAKILGQWVSCGQPTCNHRRKGKDFCFQEAPFLVMYEQGGVAVIEELNAVTQGVAFTLHPMLDDIDQFVEDDLGVVIHRHPDFWCVATMNPSEDAGALGTQQLNYALADRFKSWMYYDYDRAIEARLVKNDDRLLKIRDKLRGSNLRTETTTRMLRDFYQNVTIFGWEIAKGMFAARYPESERELVNEACKLIGG